LLCRHEAEKPNALWQADHTLLDIWVRDGSGPLVRPWLTVIMDDYSRAIAGFRISCEAPSSMQTALTLRQAMWRKSLPQSTIWGLPEIFYADNGTVFTPDILEKVIFALKMPLLFPDRDISGGRGKFNRFFRTVNKGLFGGLPGSTPVGPPPVQLFLSVRALEG